MTHESTDPNDPSDSAKFFKGGARHQTNQIYPAAKRFCELCVVIAIAPPALLAIALIALAILWTSGPPILVTQERVGMGGRVFGRLKLRTRVADASEQAATTTLLGWFLEESCLAELPQLWNVFVGDMSIVGPRPESPKLASIYRERLPNYEIRHSVRPGITGYAQVYRGCASAHTRFEYDLHYVRHMGAALDLRILRDSVLPGQRHTP